MNMDDFLIGLDLCGMGLSIAYIRAMLGAQVRGDGRSASQRIGVSSSATRATRERVETGGDQDASGPSLVQCVGLIGALGVVLGLLGCQGSHQGVFSCYLGECAVVNSLGGSVNGLVGSGLTVGNTPGAPYPFNGIAGNGSNALFGFADFNASYDVTVQTQPTNPSQICTVANGTGQTGGSYGAPTNVSNITVTCTTNPPRFVYVVNGGSNDVSAWTVDVSSGALAPADGSPFPTGHLPVAITVNPAGTHAYVANQTDATVSAFSIDRSTGALTPIEGSPFAADPSPTSVAMDPSDSYVYVTSSQAGTVAAYSVAAGGALTPLTGSPFVTGKSPSSVAVDPLDRFVYVANQADGTISDFSIGADGVLQAVSGSPFAAGAGPRSVAADPSGQYVYVGNAAADTLFGSNLYNNDVGTPATLSGSPYATGMNPVGVAVDPLDTYVYVANQGSNNVSAYELGADGGLNAVADSPFAAGSEPTAVAIDPTGRFVYVANAGASPGAGTVSVFAIAPTGALSPVNGSPYPAGTTPSAIAISD